jgi:hypothetical protein
MRQIPAAGGIYVIRSPFLNWNFTFDPELKKTLPITWTCKERKKKE